MKETKREIL